MERRFQLGIIVTEVIIAIVAIEVIVVIEAIRVITQAIKILDNRYLLIFFIHKKA